MDSEIAEGVRALRPMLAERSAAVDADGVIPQESITALIQSGLFRMLRPRWCGGLESDPLDFFDAVRTLSAACGSTGWLAGILGVSPWHVALFDERAQREIWAAEPDTLICSSYAPVGRFVPVEGGFELTGQWRIATGSAHATWALLGGAHVAENGQPTDLATALIPLSECRLTGAWDAVGLRGTGSRGLHVNRVFVPGYRTLRNYDVVTRHSAGQKLNTGPLYRMPYGAMYGTSVSAPVIGMAEGCLDAFVSRLRGDSRLSFSSSGGPESAQQVTIGHAATEIDAAILQMHRNLRDLHDCARRRVEIPMQMRLRTRRDQAFGTERAVKSVDSIFTAAGGTALRRGNPIERAWRDTHTGRTHLSNDVTGALELYGQGVLGLPVDDMLI